MFGTFIANTAVTTFHDYGIGLRVEAYATLLLSKADAHPGDGACPEMSALLLKLVIRVMTG
jgi:hypothetical protein